MLTNKYTGEHLAAREQLGVSGHQKYLNIGFTPLLTYLSGWQYHVYCLELI